MMGKFVNLHYLFGKYEVNLRKFERIVYIYELVRMAESGEVAVRT
jgi:hypothetical protein